MRHREHGEGVQREAARVGGRVERSDELVEVLRREVEPPILAQAAAWFDCRVNQVVTMGDHSCFLGEVIGCGRDPDVPPLLYYRGRFHGLGPPVAPTPWATLDRSDLIADW